MKNANWKVYTLWISLAEAAGLLSGLLSRVGMVNFSQTVAQPPLSPPGWLFPVVWTILYGLMGISAARIWLSPPSDNRSRGLNRFLAQLIVNFFWSPIFFNTGAYGFALLWLLLLWVLVVLMILSFRKVDKTAALLQIPYLIWLTFAAYLNWGVWQLNP
jgi:tryptophan-rich sensory protein